MRITHIASKDLPVPPIRGGAVQLWIEKIASCLATRHDVQVISPWVPELPLTEKIGNLTYTRIRFGRAYTRIFQKILGVDPLDYGSRIAEEATTFRPDVVHIHGGGSQWIPKLRKKLGRSVPIVVHLHNDPGEELHKWRYRDWQVSITFVACSHFIRQAAIQHLGISAETCKVVHNGVDTSEFFPYWERQDMRKQGRARYGIPIGALVLIFAGRVAPEKGPQRLARAAAPLMEANQNLWIVFAGGYKDQPDPRKMDWYQTYQSIKQSLANAWDRVVFTGHISPYEMPHIFISGDIFVGPAEWNEPFGMVYVEAMASGLPVVATKRGGIPEVVNSGVGELVDHPDQLTGTIAKLVDNEELRELKAHTARRRAQDSFDWSVVCQNIEALYLRPANK